MTFALFMLILNVLLVLMGIDTFFDEKFNINDRFINWIISKLEKRGLI